VVGEEWGKEQRVRDEVRHKQELESVGLLGHKSDWLLQGVNEDFGLKPCQVLGGQWVGGQRRNGSRAPNLEASFGGLKQK
jgi:hypothetical protein